MFTPSISASSTSVPPVISRYAFSTQVSLPPFLYQLPFIDATTTGSAAVDRRIQGASSVAERGEVPATRPAAAPCFRNSRRETGMHCSP